MPQRLGRAFDCELAGRVRHVARQSGDSGQRAHHDDAAAPLPAHLRQHGLGQEHGAEEIGLHHLAKPTLAEILERTCPEHARVVDQDVEPSGVGDDRLNRAGESVRARHVERDDPDVEPGRVGGRAQAGRLAGIAHRRDDRIAGARECERRGLAHAAAAAGDQHNGHDGLLEAGYRLSSG